MLQRWNITTTATFLNELLGLPQQTSRLVTQKVRVLEQDPVSARGDAKKLDGYRNNVYRVRVGDYRLFYSFGGGWVKLLSVRKRDERTYADAVQRFEPPGAPPDPALLEPQPRQISEPAWVAPAAEEPAPELAPEPMPEQAAPEPRPLQTQLSEELLRQWQIPVGHWPALLAARTEDDLLSADLPVALFDRVCDILFPRPIEEISAQPEFVLPQPEDLDRFVEGDLAAFLLRLDEGQQQILATAGDGPALVKGGPGTGKSVLALYRVRLLVEQGRTPVLFTTYTNALVGYSRQLLEQLLGAPPEGRGVQVATVDSLAFRLYARHYGPPVFATEGQLLAALERALEQADIPAANVFDRRARLETLRRLPPAYLLAELLEVIEARGVATREEYLVLERRGRTTPLRAPAREALWAVYQAWVTELDRQGLTCWERLRRHALALAQEQPERPFRALVVDEAQDLSPVALRFLLALVESPRALYLTADASQSLYGRGWSWRQIHADLDLRGRTLLLRRNYRNTAEISAACAAILRGTGAGDEESIAQETAAHHGSPPALVLSVDDEAEARALRAFFTAAARRFRLPVHSGTVLCHSQAAGQRLAARLSRLGLPAEFMTGKQIDLRKPVLKVLTLHAAKGLEFPFVAVTRLEDGALPHSLADLPEDERPAALDQQRRLFYVGCSRAMRALLVCGSASLPSPFLAALESPLWQRQEE
ncbi:MAG TPA: 3'-5' exonuclease [Roseiflexaceae bacterium]|nr:3'-5' exonuclease [Roseiflexaceae bacterium]